MKILNCLCLIIYVVLLVRQSNFCFGNVINSYESLSCFYSHFLALTLLSCPISLSFLLSCSLFLTQLLTLLLSISPSYSHFLSLTLLSCPISLFFLLSCSLFLTQLLTLLLSISPSYSHFLSLTLTQLVNLLHYPSLSFSSSFFLLSLLLFLF